jgi:predicted Fe-Mo cluster-binding NifX family protein
MSQPFRVAVGTSDERSVCEHFARSSAFVVHEVSEGRVVSTDVRRRGADGCESHGNFLDLLNGCSVVVCGGISETMEAYLITRGIESVVTAGKHSIHEAVKLYMAGKLPTTSRRSCICH